MANTTESIAAPYGHGTRTVQGFHSAGRPLPTIDHVCGLYEVPAGQATIQISLQGAALTAASASEGDAAATPQAFNAVDTKALTPGSYVGAVSPTTEAVNRVDPNIVDLVKFHEDEVVYPHKRITAYDATIGVVKALFVAISNTVGTALAPMTPVTLTTAFRTLCTQMKTELDAFAWISIKQWTELLEYGLTTASASWGNPNLDILFRELLEINQMPVSGYKTSWGPIHIFVDPDPLGLGVDGSGNDIGCMFVPALAGLNGFQVPKGVESRYAASNREMPGGLPLSPAFAIGYRAEPAAAVRKIAMPAGMGARVVTKSGIPIDVMPRLYAGQNLGQIDAWSAVTTVEVNDLAGVRLRSVT